MQETEIHPLCSHEIHAGRAVSLIALFLAAAISIILTFGLADQAYAAGTKSSTANVSSVNSKNVELNLSATTTIYKYSKGKLVKKNGSYYFYNKKGKTAKSCWKTINKKRYYFKKNGKAATGSFKVENVYYIFKPDGSLYRPKSARVYLAGNKKYCVDSNGMALSGWVAIRGKLYHAKKTGLCEKSTVIDKIPINSKGYGNPSNLRTKLMIKALGTLSEILYDGMTQEQKLERCWNVLMTYAFRIEKTPDIENPDWMYQCAYDSLTEKAHNCWGISCAFCMLAKVLGEEPYLIAPPEGVVDGHCWVKIGNGFWDNKINARNAPSGFYPTEGSRILLYW